MFGDSLTTEQLITLRDRLGNKCVEVLDMPEDALTAHGPKGQTSPEEFGSVIGFFTILAQRALDSRQEAE